MPRPPKFPWEPQQLEWLKALESGDYLQTLGRLRNPDGFCCLGVACDLKDENRWACDDDGENTVWWWKAEPGGNAPDDGGVLPEAVWKWLRLRDGNGIFAECNLTQRDKVNVAPQIRLHAHLQVQVGMLSALNDVGWTFAEIAAFVRRNPGAVFNNADPAPEDESHA